MAVFVPRLTDAGMQGNPWWYSSGNPFYPTYGLPNCTCYAYGRYAEIRNGFAPLPTGDAKTWWGRAQGHFQCGQVPQLGAVLCWGTNVESSPGHVAVVEEIAPNGDITLSNSSWGGPYFFVSTATASSGYSNPYVSHYFFQGFIYNDAEPTPPVPASGKKMPIWMYLKSYRL